MRGSDETNNNEKYARDVQTIKDLLSEIEEKPLVENWAFFVWGALFIAGAVFHYIAVELLGFGVMDLILKVWTPVLIVTCIVEIIAGIRNLLGEGLPILSRRLFKLIVGFAVYCTVFIIVLIILVQNRLTMYLPSITLMFMSVFFVLYAQVSYLTLYIPACVMLGAGIILFLYEPQTSLVSASAGALMGLAFIGSGFLTKGRHAPG
jgi:hypothetical protein